MTYQTPDLLHTSLDTVTQQIKSISQFCNILPVNNNKWLIAEAIGFQNLPTVVRLQQGAPKQFPYRTWYMQWDDWYNHS
jgi:hypothetical protein